MICDNQKVHASSFQEQIKDIHAAASLLKPATIDFLEVMRLHFEWSRPNNHQNLADLASFCASARMVSGYSRRLDVSGAENQRCHALMDVISVCIYIS